MEKEIEHLVTLRIKPDGNGRTMTEKQVKKWLEDWFKGIDYGEVRVTDVINLESKKQ